MNLLKQTNALCNLYNIKPTRTKGQNFLVSENIYDDIIEVSELSSDDMALEVGPGLGFLTFKIAEKVKKLVTVELDDKLAEVLQIGVIEKKTKNIEIVNADILDCLSGSKFLIEKFKGKGYKIIANLPYNITSVFLRKSLSGELKPSLMVLMIQKDVAERIVAKPGKMSLLSLSAQYFSNPEIIRDVSSDNFWPAPQVDSSIIKFKNIGQKYKLNKQQEKRFFQIAKIGFSSKRKMLKNNLANGLQISQEEVVKILEQQGFDSKIRAQNLSIEDWIGLIKKL